MSAWLYPIKEHEFYYYGAMGTRSASPNLASIFVN